MFRLSRLLLFGLLFTPYLILAPAVFAASGPEFQPIESLPGSQVLSSVAVNSSGGYVVWQDGVSDGRGLGIRARKLDENFQPILENFPVSTQIYFDQQNARVAVLANGTAVFVWQGGKPGAQDIFARARLGDGRWRSREIFVNTFRRSDQIEPSIGALKDGGAAVAWSSFRQDGGFLGIYAQRLSGLGQKVGREIPVNQHTDLNQRNSAIAGLATGGFVVTWVSDAQRSPGSVDVYARIFDAKGQPSTGEIPVSPQQRAASEPDVVATGSDGFVITWAEAPDRRRGAVRDIFARSFSSNGTAFGEAVRVNSHLEEDQFRPKIAASADSYLIAWTSMRQDGYWEGVFGQYFNLDGSRRGDEMQINLSNYYRQIDPAVAMLPSGKGIAVWSHYVLGGPAFDLFARRIP